MLLYVDMETIDMETVFLLIQLCPNTQFVWKLGCE